MKISLNTCISIIINFAKVQLFENKVFVSNEFIMTLK